MNKLQKNHDHKVIIVVDPSYGGQLVDLSKRVHVWAIDTPENRAVTEKIWKEMEQSQGGHSLESGITLFQGENTSPEESCLGILGAVNEHHGVYSHDPPWNRLEVIGAGLTDEIRTVLEKICGAIRSRLFDGGFEVFRETSKS